MATMADVAKRAGVALSTVSHTLSGKRPISAEVRQRVLQSIEELGYRPHALARALATKRTKTIALLYPAPSSEVTETHLEFVSGVLQATNLRKYGLLLWTAPDEDEEAVHMIQQGFVDGQVLMEIKLEDPRVRMLKDLAYPFTMIGHCTECENMNFVDLDFDYALHTCVKYLVELGHTRLAFINNSSELFQLGLGYVVRSENAFRQAVTQWGVEGISIFCDSNTQAGYTATQTLLTRESSPTALIVLNAWVHGGVIRAIYDQGLRIPADISLVGIVSPHVAEMMVPPLTNLEFPYKAMGYMGADLLIRQLEGETVSVQEFLKPPLIIRQSSGPR